MPIFDTTYYCGTDTTVTIREVEPVLIEFIPASSFSGVYTNNCLDNKIINH